MEREGKEKEEEEREEKKRKKKKTKRIGNRRACEEFSEQFHNALVTRTFRERPCVPTKLGCVCRAWKLRLRRGVREWQAVEPHIGKAEWGEAESGGRKGAAQSWGVLESEDAPACEAGRLTVSV